MNASQPSPQQSRDGARSSQRDTAIEWQKKPSRLRLRGSSTRTHPDGVAVGMTGQVLYVPGVPSQGDKCAGREPILVCVCHASVNGNPGTAHAGRVSWLRKWRRA